MKRLRVVPSNDDKDAQKLLSLDNNSVTHATSDSSEPKNVIQQIEGIELISLTDVEHCHGINSQSDNNSVTHDKGDTEVHEV